MPMETLAELAKRDTTDTVINGVREYRDSQSGEVISIERAQKINHARLSDLTGKNISHLLLNEPDSPAKDILFQKFELAIAEYEALKHLSSQS
jgi:hypothetical protein